MIRVRAAICVCDSDSDNLKTSQLLSSVPSSRQAFKILWKFPVVVFITVNEKSDCSVQFMWSSFSYNQMQSTLKDCLHSLFMCVSACFLFKFVCSLPFLFLVQNFPDYSQDSWEFHLRISDPKFVCIISRLPSILVWRPFSVSVPSVSARKFGVQNVCTFLPSAPSRPSAAVTGIQQPPSVCRFAFIGCRICSY